MASSRDRQRALARAKLERQMARRAAAARRRRQIQAGVAAVIAVAVVIAGVVWLVSELGGGEKKPTATNASKTPGLCQYTDLPKDQKIPERKDVGKPEAGVEARAGIRIWTLNTNRGKIEIELDAKKAPCNTESLAYLTGKKFFDDSSCHRLTDKGLFVLQCGDPSATGKGGPSYQVNDENLPIGQNPAYPGGVVAMANSGPKTNGSQFFIVYKDSQLPPDYTIVGRVVEGLGVVEKVAKAGHDGSQGEGDGKPKQSVTVKTATVTAPQPKGDDTPDSSASPATEPSQS